MLIQISNLNLNSSNTNDFQQGLETQKSLEHGMFFFFFALLTSIYNQAMFMERTTRQPPSEMMKEGLRLICILILGEFIFFVLFCSNNYFCFYKLGYICMNYDGNNNTHHHQYQHWGARDASVSRALGKFLFFFFLFFSTSEFILQLDYICINYNFDDEYTRAGQGITGVAGARDMTRLGPLGMFFFLFFLFFI